MKELTKEEQAFREVLLDIEKNVFIQSDILKHEISKFKKSYQHYLTKNGIILPFDVWEFLQWFFDLPGIQEKLINGYICPEIPVHYFSDFHKYKEQQFLNLNTQNEPDREPAKNSHTINQIALLRVYLGEPVTKENMTSEAAKYGFKGQKLYQQYCFFSERANRKAKPEPFTPAKMKNKIALFESVLELLPNSHRQSLLDELSILKTIYETEFL